MGPPTCPRARSWLTELSAPSATPFPKNLYRHSVSRFARNKYNVKVVVRGNKYHRDDASGMLDHHLIHCSHPSTTDLTNHPLPAVQITKS